MRDGEEDLASESSESMLEMESSGARFQIYLEICLIPHYLRGDLRDGEEDLASESSKSAALLEVEFMHRLVLRKLSFVVESMNGRFYSPTMIDTVTNTHVRVLSNNLGF